MDPTINISMSMLKYMVGFGCANVHMVKYYIRACFIIMDACTWSCLGRIGTREMCCVKPLVFSEEGLKINYCRMEMHKIQKSYPPTLANAFEH